MEVRKTCIFVSARRISEGYDTHFLSPHEDRMEMYCRRSRHCILCILLLFWVANIGKILQTKQISCHFLSKSQNHLSEV